MASELSRRVGKAVSNTRRCQRWAILTDRNALLPQPDGFDVLGVAEL
jgi:hypothetical protein